MNRQQLLGVARGFLPLKAKNVGVETPTYKGITSEVGWGFSPTKSKPAFTLAEVLITLGIIGIVAAMTLPTLIKKYTNHVVENRLKLFYSQVNEAIKLSEAEYGDKKDWFVNYRSGNYDADKVDEWFMTYIGKHLKIIKTERLATGEIFYYLANGSTFGFHNKTTRDWLFFPGNFKKCLKAHGNSYYNVIGYCAFTFNFMPMLVVDMEEWQYLYNKGLEPWKYRWDGTEDYLKERCKGGQRNYCSTWIQYNNWTIPDDYPYPVGLY